MTTGASKTACLVVQVTTIIVTNKMGVLCESKALTDNTIFVLALQQITVVHIMPELARQLPMLKL